MKRLGLVGAGAWAKRFVQTVERRDDARIVAFARASRREDAVVVGARQCASFAELIELAGQRELEGLLVATNPDNQAEVALAALRAGVPAFVEKPIGSSATVLAPIVECWRSLARPELVLVDYVHLFAPAFVALKARVDESLKAGGKIRSINTRGHNRGPFRATSALYDYGTHDVAMCLSLIGPPARFELRSARRRTPSWGAPGELIDARFALDQCEVALTVGNGSDTKARLFDVALRDGARLVYDDLVPPPRKLMDSGVPVPISPTMPLDASLGYFIERLGQQPGPRTLPAHPASSLDFSLRVAEILDEIERAAACPR